MKVVIDTNVMISGLLNPSGIPAQVLNLLLRGRITILYDNRIMSEYRDVLHREKFGFASEAIEPLLELVKAGGEFVVPDPHPAAFKDDDDRAFYEVALSGDADFLVTGNSTHFPGDKRVRSPAEFLRAYLSGPGRGKGRGGRQSR